MFVIPVMKKQHNMYEKDIQEAKLDIQAVTNRDELEAARVKWLGRKDGRITNVMKQIVSLPHSQRAAAGQAANIFKRQVEAELALAQAALETAEDKSVADVSWPGTVPTVGSIHPVNQMVFKIWEVFRSMNFEICEGPEIETDWNNFESLNMSPDHPARDMQDTFYVPGGLLLRTHTTSTNSRVMKGRKAPIRILSTGKCYRRDSSLRHSPVFHQFDGMMLDTDISMANLKWTLRYSFSRILEQEIDVRFRYSYFPFTEPSAELDVTCTICSGQGCAVCKHSGWLELGGCGMLHPNVIKNIGLNPKEIQGFAFGFGIERPFMIKHRVPNIRLFFDNDPRFLSQFQTPSV